MLFFFLLLKGESKYKISQNVTVSNSTCIECAQYSKSRYVFSVNLATQVAYMSFSTVIFFI
jgi:hypothetical protein